MISKKFIAIFITLILLFSVKFSYTQSCYELVWGDEFNYNGLPDSTLWSFEEGGDGWGNNELQYYTSKRIENAHVEDGFLTIEARKEDYNGRDYTSARLITYPKNHSWKYGKIEARIKLPYGQGIWPAFWALGNGIFEGTSWPACGEIDIMEMIGGGEGRDDVVHGTLHYSDANNNHGYNGGEYQLSNGIFADDFHTFSIEWTESQIKWFVDGNQYFSKSLLNAELIEFQKEFFLLLNIAVGGNWPGSPDAQTVFPQKMVVDYVRVYQLNSQPKIIGDSIINKAKKNINYKTVESEDFIYNWTVADDATITQGQGTNSIDVTWGCEPGIVMCQVSTTCSGFDLILPIKTEKIEISGEEKLEAFSENNKYALPELFETEYNWEAPDDVTFIGNNNTNIVFLDWGTTEGIVNVSISNNCGIEQDSIFVDVVQQLPYPDPDTKHAIPGTIQAIHYDYGGEGFSYHDNEAANLGSGSRQDEGVDTEANDGGENIGWIKAGEWVEYTVDVDTSGLYDIELRIASLPGGGEMEILFGGESRTGEISIPGTGSWSTFTSIYLNDIQLYDTDTLMRLQFNIGDFNISRLIFEDNSTHIKDSPLKDSEIILYPNPVNDNISIFSDHKFEKVTISNLIGQEIISYNTFGNSFDISLVEFKTGLYYVSIYHVDGNVVTMKVIKK